MRDAVDGFLTIVERYDDGSKLVTNRAFGFQIPAGMQIHVRTIAGVTFLDGAGAIYLTKDDFDELGQWQVELLSSGSRVGSACRWYKVSQNGLLVGQQNK